MKNIISKIKNILKYSLFYFKINENGYESLIIAKEIFKQTKYPLTNLRLQKLLYFAHGINLCLYNKPLLNQSFVAWDKGPVSKPVYYKLRHYGGDIINKREFDYLNLETNHHIKKIVKKTLNLLDDKSISYLVNLSKDNVWKNAYDLDKPIENILIKKYFKRNYINKR